jgi:DNA-binding NtrC family response regulator
MEGRRAMKSGKERILVVDDEKGLRLTFQSFLADEGYDVSIAEDYDAGLKQIDAKDFDLVISDIILGGKTGLDVVREVKKRNPACPVVLITGYPNLETASEAVRLGAFDYLSKPVVQEALLRVARQALLHKSLFDEKEQYRTQLDAIFKSVQEAIIAVDDALVVCRMNDAVSAICGLRENCLGNRFTSLQLDCEGACSRILEDVIRTRRSSQSRHIECRRTAHPALVVSATAHPMFGQSGKASGAVLVIRDETRLHELESAMVKRTRFHAIVGRSDKMQKIYSLIDALSDVPTTVLVTGESGTGKELVAEAIHRAGTRGKKPLIKVNCSALNENLLESELFGHKKGAFTGAVQDRAGRFEMADGGSIFLDEIGDISPRIQVSLLRILQDKIFERVGDAKPIRTDVRVIAATNQDLRKKVSEGTFREDLYYRLKVVELNIPPLRERRDDIPLLVQHFLEKHSTALSRPVLATSSDVERHFMQYRWPGNVRELEHMLEHACLLSRGAAILVGDLPPDFLAETGALDESPEFTPQGILGALEKAAWNKARAAHILGISRATLYRKLKELGIDAEDPMKKKL